jgi:Tol biopolymer transport system component
LRRIRKVDDSADLPSWSPDGRYIAYRRPLGPLGQNRFWLEVIGADGSAPHYVGNGFDQQAAPQWSPDSRHILSIRNGQLFAVAPTGGAEHLLAAGGKMRFDQAAWSPDGTKLAVEIEQPKGAYSGAIAAVADSDGRDMKLFAKSKSEASSVTETRMTEWANAGPSWSPDGKRIAITIIRRGETHVYILNADGSALDRLARGRGDDFAPAWQPAG